MLKMPKWASALVVFIGLGATESARGADLPATPTRTGVAPSAESRQGRAVSGPAATTETATGSFGMFGRAAEWFFPEKDSPDHERTWGFVPLIVADSNAGFGEGVKVVENDLLGTSIRVDALADYTSNQFFEAQTTVTGPKLEDVLSWDAWVAYRNRPRLYFFGIGNSAKREGRGSLLLEETSAEGRLGFESTKNLTIYSIFRFSNVNARDGPQNHSIPPVSQRFDTSRLTGFGDEGLTNAVGMSFEYDILDNRFDPTFGARLQMAGLYHGPELGDSDFRYGFYWVDLAAYAPVIERRLTLCLHGRLEVVDAGLARVPFYALPQLGGTRTLRGFFEGRIRDRQSLLFQAELRFPIWKVIDGAVFVDAGRVYHDLLAHATLHHPYIDGGAGIRFVIHPDIVVRLDFAVSVEDVLFALDFGHAF